MIIDVGKTVSFGYKGVEISGLVKRINKKTYTVITSNGSYYVPFASIIGWPTLKPKIRKKWSNSQKCDYLVSKTATIKVNQEEISNVLNFVNDLGLALISGEEEHIHQNANHIVNSLNKIYNLPPSPVYTRGKRTIFRRSQIHGLHKTWINQGREKTSISVFSRTAKRCQFVKPKTFLNTLLHEWIHHYDKFFLKIEHLFHTSGFYNRLNTIYKVLKGVLEEQKEILRPN